MQKRSAARGGNDMFRIWAKIMKEGKIQRQFVYENDEEKLTYSHFMDYLFDICHELDISTPVLLKTPMMVLKMILMSSPIEQWST